MQSKRAKKGSSFIKTISQQKAPIAVIIIEVLLLVFKV